MTVKTLLFLFPTDRVGHIHRALFVKSLEAAEPRLVIDGHYTEIDGESKVLVRFNSIAYDKAKLHTHLKEVMSKTEELAKLLA